MRFGRRALWALALGGVLVASLLYVPVYEGQFERPVLLALTLSTLRIGSFMYNSAIRTGMLEYLNMLNPVWATGSTAIHILMGTKIYDVKAEDMLIDGVPVRVFYPPERAPQSGAVVFFHGGGWSAMNVDIYDDHTRRIARDTKAVVISVDYRLAPTHMFPAGFNDCLAVTEFTLGNAHRFGIDPTRVVLMGDSAGGNLAAAVSIKLRHRAQRPKLQVLMYPPLQAIDFNTPSYQVNKDDVIVNRDLAISCLSMYAQGNINDVHVWRANNHTTPVIKVTMANSYLNYDNIPSNITGGKYQRPSLDHGHEDVWRNVQDTLLNPYYAPLMAKDLSNLPKALVVTCQYDVLRDDGILYQHRLRESGNDVTHIHLHHGFHGMVSLYSLFKESEDITVQIHNFIANNI